jgi:type II secretory pathway pseudopilin PulG
MIGIYIVIGVVVAVLAILAVRATLRGRSEVRAAQRVQSRELRRAAELHISKAEREHNEALEQVAEGEARRIRAEQELAHAGAQVEEAERLDPDS